MSCGNSPRDNKELNRYLNKTVRSAATIANFNRLGVNIFISFLIYKVIDIGGVE